MELVTHNVHVDDVYRLLLLALRLLKVGQRLIVDLLLASQDDVERLLALLQPLGLVLDSSVPIQDVEHPVLCVKLLVLDLQVFVDVLVGRA